MSAVRQKDSVLYQFHYLRDATDALQIREAPVFGWSSVTRWCRRLKHGYNHGTRQCTFTFTSIDTFNISRYPDAELVRSPSMGWVGLGWVEILKFLIGWVGSKMMGHLTRSVSIDDVYKLNIS